MEQPSFSQLLALYETGELTGVDLERFFELMNEEDNKQLLSAAIDDKVAENVIPETANHELTERGVERLLQAIRQNDAARSTGSVNTGAMVHWLKKYWWAACWLILMAGGAYWWLLSRHTEPAIVKNVPLKNDVLPGKDGAILTLADGQQIILDSLNDGVVAKQSGTAINLKDGKLVYEVTESSAAVVYNTMSTPKGRQFRLTLPDGTKVWLNAASSIRYPTVFEENERRVSITGEVYFEVNGNPGKPFYVNVNEKATVEVLGTNFNVNAYEDENIIQTTLLEGKVRIVKSADVAILLPNQQAIIQDNNIRTVSNVNTVSVMAWKNGVFYFTGNSLATVMRQLARWYNVDIEYTRGIPVVELYGKAGRDLNLMQVLLGLQEMGLHCRVEGRKLIVDSASK